MDVEEDEVGSLAELVDISEVCVGDGGEYNDSPSSSYKSSSE
jgi:hypothetical protein